MAAERGAFKSASEEPSAKSRDIIHIPAICIIYICILFLPPVFEGISESQLGFTPSEPYFAKFTVDFKTTHVVQDKNMSYQNFPEIYGGTKKIRAQILGLQQTHGGQFHEQTTFQGICQEIETVRLDHGLSGWGGVVFFPEKRPNFNGRPKTPWKIDFLGQNRPGIFCTNQKCVFFNVFLQFLLRLWIQFQKCKVHQNIRKDGSEDSQNLPLKNTWR